VSGPVSKNDAVSSPPASLAEPAVGTSAPSSLVARRVVAWLIDLAIVAALVGLVYLLGLIRINGCDSWNEATQTFGGSCPFEQVKEVQRSDGRTDLVYVLDSGREISQDHPTVKTVLLGTRVVDPPRDATYLVGLAYVLVMFVGVQGLTGWTPGKALTGLRLVRADGQPAGIGAAFTRWFVVDGAIGLIGVVIALVGGPWPLRLLAADAAVGLLGGAAALGTDGRRPGDQLAGTRVGDESDLRRRPAGTEPRRERDDAELVRATSREQPAEAYAGTSATGAEPGAATPPYGGGSPSAFAEPVPPFGTEPVPPFGTEPVPPFGTEPVPPFGTEPVPPSGTEPVSADWAGSEPTAEQAGDVPGQTAPPASTIPAWDSPEGAASPPAWTAPPWTHTEPVQSSEASPGHDPGLVAGAGSTGEAASAGIAGENEERAGASVWRPGEPIAVGPVTAPGVEDRGTGGDERPAGEAVGTAAEAATDLPAARVGDEPPEPRTGTSADSGERHSWEAAPPLWEPQGTTRQVFTIPDDEPAAEQQQAEQQQTEQQQTEQQPVGHEPLETTPWAEASRAEPTPEPDGETEAEAQARPAEEPTAERVADRGSVPGAQEEPPGAAAEVGGTGPGSTGGAGAEPSGARQPQWDEARQAYIFWDDSRQEWLQYDYAAQRWGPISRA
jgi:uncharacterized RDD family membrane protein YckC